MKGEKEVSERREGRKGGKEGRERREGKKGGKEGRGGREGKKGGEGGRERREGREGGKEGRGGREGKKGGEECRERREGKKGWEGRKGERRFNINTLKNGTIVIHVQWMSSFQLSRLHWFHCKYMYSTCSTKEPVYCGHYWDSSDKGAVCPHFKSRFE